MNNNHNQPIFAPEEIAPHSQDAEEAVLGSILINPAAFVEVADLLTPDDFFILRNNWVFEAMGRLYQRRKPVEYLMVIEELRKQDRLDHVGGASYITYLASNVASSIYAEAYGEVIGEASLRRKILAAVEEIKRLARNGEITAREAAMQCQTILDKAVNRAVKHDWVHVRDLASDYFSEIEAKRNKEIETLGIKTNLNDLDSKIRGFHSGRFYLIGGRPGMGKTWFLLYCALQAARQGKRAGIVSMEMDRKEIINRIIALMTGLNSQAIAEGDMNDTEWQTFVDAQAEFESLDIFIDDAGFQTPRGLTMKCKRLQARYGLDIVFVDYLQLGHSDEQKQNSYERVSAFSRALAALSKGDALNIPVVAAAQLNRDLEDRQDKRPMLSDLRESGQLEQDASCVLFLYRDFVYNENTEDENECEIIVSKNRHNGGKKGLGTVYAFYDNDNPCFKNLRKEKKNIDEEMSKAGQNASGKGKFVRNGRAK